MKWQPTYDFYKQFLEALGTTSAEPKWKAAYFSSVHQLKYTEPRACDLGLFVLFKKELRQLYWKQKYLRTWIQQS